MFLFIIFSNIWDTTKTIDKDYLIIKKIHKKISTELIDHLYSLHQKKISRKIWKNLIFVWLTYYLFFYYFKWKTIEKIFKKEKKLNFIYYQSGKKIIHIDSLDFYNESSNSDLFNYLAFKKIILYKKKKKLINVKIITKKEKLKNNFNLINNTQKISFRIHHKIFSLFKHFFLSPNLLVLDGINTKLNFFLNLSLMQFPCIYKNAFNWNETKKKIHVREKIENRKKLKNSGSNFEKFIKENIINDIPLCFTDGFETLNNDSNKINFNPKIIISGTQHFHNELAKLWLLKQKYNLNKKLFIVSHGGGHQKLSLTIFDYEHQIGNYFFQWLDKKKFKNTRLPNTKYSFNIKNRNNNVKKIIFVGNELKPYINRISPGPMSISSANTINDLELIYKNLKKNIKPKVYYSPKKKMIKIFENKTSRILEKNKILPIGKLEENIKNSKLVICSYPQTAFFDSIMSGPTILVYNPKLWRQYKELDKVYKILKLNNIVFDNPDAASKHINKIWNQIDVWWNKKEVVNAKNLFLRQFNLPPKNQLMDVFKCLKAFKNV